MNPNTELKAGAPLLGERLVDAREAAYCLNLPSFWLTHPKERARRQLPHYRVGKLVRFKLSELEAWLQTSAAAQGTGDRHA